MTLAHVHMVAFERIEALNEPVDGLLVDDPPARGVQAPISTGWRACAQRTARENIGLPKQRDSGECVASIP